MKDPRHNSSYSVSFDQRGRATIRGEDADTVTVTPGREDYQIVVHIGPDWPRMYVGSVEEAQAYLADKPGSYEHQDESVTVRWFLTASTPDEPEIGFVDLASVMEYAAVRARRRDHRMVTIQPSTLPDLSRPYPYHIKPDSQVARQDFWKGRPGTLVGFQQRADVQQVDLKFQDFWACPRQAIGLYPVFVDGGDLMVYRVAIESVTEQVLWGNEEDR